MLPAFSRKNLLPFLLLLFSVSVFAQNKDTKVSQEVKKQDEIYIESGNLKAEFPGGDKAFYQYLNTRVDVILNDSTIKLNTGKMVVQFVVDTLGKVTQCKIVKGVAPEMDARVLAVFRKMPDWKPAHINGRKVKVYKMIPIKFSR
jgi:TonB family protein